jgi:serine/threonine protein kinase
LTVAIGTRLGSYEITGAIGAGGMGGVFRARDTRLHRDVAIKVLPELFATDPERLTRFEREATTLASLNHPNIAQIYGLESVGATGERALVMELVEGETLAERVSRGPVPIDEALPIARQIADALEAAHDCGIIHRDLKPANIKVRPDGTVKVLDFGLAKSIDPSGVLSGVRRGQLPDLYLPCGHGDRRDPPHCRVHGARAGTREGRRLPCGHLGIRRHGVRNAHWQAVVCRGVRVRGARVHFERWSELGDVAP